MPGEAVLEPPAQLAPSVGKHHKKNRRRKDKAREQAREERWREDRIAAWVTTLPAHRPAEARLEELRDERADVARKLAFVRRRMVSSIQFSLTPDSGSLGRRPGRDRAPRNCELGLEGLTPAHEGDDARDCHGGGAA